MNGLTVIALVVYRDLMAVLHFLATVPAQDYVALASALFSIGYGVHVYRVETEEARRTRKDLLERVRDR